MLVKRIEDACLFSGFGWKFEEFPERKGWTYRRRAAAARKGRSDIAMSRYTLERDAREMAAAREELDLEFELDAGLALYKDLGFGARRGARPGGAGLEALSRLKVVVSWAGKGCRRAGLRQPGIRH